MLWHLVVIERFTAQAAEPDCNALVEKFMSESGAACANSDVEVWHRKDGAATHRFYFSPTAVSSAPETLKSFKSVACGQKPDLTEFEKLRGLNP
jgi:hypothetical protein